jgi:hypothetical protein
MSCIVMYNLYSLTTNTITAANYLLDSTHQCVTYLAPNVPAPPLLPAKYALHTGLHRSHLGYVAHWVYSSPPFYLLYLVLSILT